MKTAVWDTYVKKKDGSVMHFDIIVPDDMHDAARIYEYGAVFLKSKNERDALLDARLCRFCHVEDLQPEWEDAIARNGYYILEMEDIPARLPGNPTRREMILHLRAHTDEYRFADFKEKSSEELKQLLRQIQ